MGGVRCEDDPLPVCLRTRDTIDLAAPLLVDSAELRVIDPACGRSNARDVRVVMMCAGAARARTTSVVPMLQWSGYTGLA